MFTLPTWGGVDWFGCEDDLEWGPLDGVLAEDDRDLPATGTPIHATRSSSVSPTRRVLILDVENICPGSRRTVRALTQLRAVLKAAGPVDQIIAASAANQHARLDQLLRMVGVHVHTCVKNRPNAADRALIQAARRFAADGDCEVILASNDHGFRRIARMPGVRRVVLITVPHLATARSLIRAVDELRVAAA
jgi:hypothetical protein